MDPREELAALRRMAELEARAGAQRQAKIDAQVEADRKQYDPAAGMNMLERGLVGAGAAADRALSGLKGLIPGMEESQQSKDDRAIYNKYRDNLGTAGKVGEVAADVAMTAMPVTKGMQAIGAAGKYLPRAMQFMSRGVPAAAMAGGAVSAAVDPDNRAGAALGGALGGAGGELAGRALTKTLGGLVSNRVTPEARTLMDQGVHVPLWKGTESKILRDVAERAKVLPVVGNMMRGQERAAFDDFNRVMAGRATPPKPVLDEAGNILRWENAPVAATGSDAMEQLGKRFNESYDALYKGRGIPVDDVYGRETADILSSAKNYYPRIAGDVDSAFRQADDILRKGTESTTKASPILDEAGKPFVNTELGHATTRPESLKQAIDSLDTRITSAYQRGDAETAEVLKQLRGQVDDLRMRGLPPEVASQAGDINKAYATFKQLQRANSQLGAQTSGVTSPRQMLSAIKANDRTPGKSAFSSGKALNQEDVLRAEQVLGNRIPEVGPGTAEKLLPAIGFGLPMIGYDAGLTALLGTKTGQRFLMGGLPGQAGVRKYGSEYVVPALRSFGTVAGN